VLFLCMTRASGSLLSCLPSDRYMSVTLVTERQKSIAQGATVKVVELEDVLAR
jgi:hypothetical protein